MKSCKRKHHFAYLENEFTNLLKAYPKLNSVLDFAHELLMSSCPMYFHHKFYFKNK